MAAELDSGQFLALLKRRRSRREFTRQDIDPPQIERALQAAMRAASGANAQPWLYVLIERGTLRDSIREHCERADEDFHKRSPPWLKQFFADQQITPVKQFTETAPLLVAVFGKRDFPFWLQSVWLSIANFINALEVEGLHSLTYTPSLDKQFNKLIGVDESYSCQALLPVGIGNPEEELQPRPRKPLSESVKVLGSDGKLREFEPTLPFEP